jgi:hypothetical protein
MPVNVKWMDDAKTILMYECQDEWTWEEAWDAFDIGHPMLEASPHVVDVIIDFMTSEGMPQGARGQIRELTDRAAENWGLCIVTGEDAMAQQIMFTLSKIFPKLGERFRMVKNREAALELIQEYRSNSKV